MRWPSVLVVASHAWALRYVIEIDDVPQPIDFDVGGAQAKHLLPVAQALRGRGVDPDALQRLAWIDCNLKNAIILAGGADGQGKPKTATEPAECAPVGRDGFHGARRWFEGLVATLFARRSSLDVDVDADGWLARTRAAHLDVDAGLACFEHLVVPGESDYLVRGPADARRLRQLAYEAAGLPRHRERGNRTALVIDREDGRGIADVGVVLRALAAAGVDKVERATLTNRTFDDQVRLFERAALVVASHGAGLTNMLFLREGAAVVELKQYGEYSTTFRDLASSAKIQHFAVYSRKPPFPVSEDCPAQVYLNDFAGAPAMTCIELLHKHPNRPDPPVDVDAAELAAALRDATRASGLVPLACSCEAHDWKPQITNARHLANIVAESGSEVQDIIRKYNGCV